MRMCVRHDSFICVTCCFHACDTTTSYVWHDSFMAPRSTHAACVCEKNLWYVWCSSFMRVTHSCVWLIHVCDSFMCDTHSWVVHVWDSFMCVTHSCVWPSFMRYTHSCVWLIHVRDSFMCVTRLIHMCVMTPSWRLHHPMRMCARHDSLICVTCIRES